MADGIFTMAVDEESIKSIKELAESAHAADIALARATEAARQLQEELKRLPWWIRWTVAFRK